MISLDVSSCLDSVMMFVLFQPKGLYASPESPQQQPENGSNTLMAAGHF